VIALAVDENFDRHILRALLRRLPELNAADVVTAGLGGAGDPEVLAWAASEDRVMLTHDVRTMTRFAYDRVREGLPMPGVIEVRSQTTVREVLDDLVLIITCATAADLVAQVRYVPLRR
jgi:predicted nuclease of predicted toxin-antitoxin system